MRAFAWTLFAIALSASPASAKETREAIPGSYSTFESDNFVVSWPAAIDLTTTDARAVVEALEASYVTYHDAFGLPLPPGADTYRFNAYVADSTTVPAIDFGGYMQFGDGEVPFLVLHVDLVLYDPGLPFVAAHEYFHAVQYTTGAYGEAAVAGTHPADWYFESTATWAATQVFPDDEVPFGDLASYLAGTEHALFLTYSDVDDASPVAGHEYGAFLFPLHLSIAHGAELISDSFLLAGDTQDPLVVLDGLLENGSIEDELRVFAARNAAWDYPSPVREHIEGWLPTIVDDARPLVVATLAETDSELGIDPAGDRPLHAFGYHVLALPQADAALRVVVEGDAEGSAGTLGALVATLTIRSGDGVAYAPLVDDSGRLVATLPATDDGEAFLSVASVADTRDPHETFRYRVALVREATVDDTPDAGDAGADDGGPVDDEPGDAAGCAATHVDTDAPRAALLLFVLPWLTRRRRR